MSSKIAPENVVRDHSEEYNFRVEKVKKLRAMGVEPWPEAKEINASSKEVIEDFEHEVLGKTYMISGRVMSIRGHGKTIFANVQDGAGHVQVYLRKDKIGEDLFAFFEEFIDLGDIVWFKGIPFRTKMGEITLEVEDVTLESKCLRPMPEKFHGLHDVETKYRQRYLDLMTNKDTRDRFRKRSSIIRSIRSFLDGHGYQEVETPMLHPIAGGAAARPFVTHHNALDSEFYLRIAPELYLKRLVIGGFDRVYEINRNFRNEGISTRHNPEFTMLEFYTANKDYHYAMNFVEDLLRNAAREALGHMKVQYGDYLLDFSLPFARLSPKDALKLHANIIEKDLQEDTIGKLLESHNIKVKADMSLNEKIFALFEELAEHKLIQPTFIIDYPIEISPLSKRDAENPDIAARFELFIAGIELSNGFNELNDPFDQAQRFKDQLKAHEDGDEEAHKYDADFIKSLEYGLTPTVGVGIGIDRLVMFLTNTTSIKEVILFPTLKKKEEQGI